MEQQRPPTDYPRAMRNNRGEYLFAVPLGFAIVGGTLRLRSGQAASVPTRA